MAEALRKVTDGLEYLHMGGAREATSPDPGIDPDTDWDPDSRNITIIAPTDNPAPSLSPSMLQVPVLYHPFGRPRQDTPFRAP